MPGVEEQTCCQTVQMDFQLPAAAAEAVEGHQAGSVQRSAAAAVAAGKHRTVAEEVSHCGRL